MEKYYGLIIGNQVKLKHLDKTSLRFSKYYELATKEEKQTSIEIWLELHDLSPEKRDYYSVINVHNQYFSRYKTVMSNMNFDFELCEFSHGHVSICFERINYAATTYRSVNGRTLFFYESEDNDESTLRNRLLKLPLHQQYLSLPHELKNDDYEFEFTKWIRSVLEID